MVRLLLHLIASSMDLHSEIWIHVDELPMKELLMEIKGSKFICYKIILLIKKKLIDSEKLVLRG
jgi:hypothetical protein